MKRRQGRGLGGPCEWLAALLLVAVALPVGWLSLRAALVRITGPTAPGTPAIGADDPDLVLGRAASALVRQRGILSPATLAAVRRAAAAAPLDARAFLILGHQQLLDREPARALKTLEAGQRLDPRQRLIHLLLLDRYLRTARYADASTQFSVLARLMGQTQAPIATAMAQMAFAPETRDAVRRTLANDPNLERAVLVALARSDTAPAALFAFASPFARAHAGGRESWGPVLVSRLVERGRFAEAHSVWQRIYGVSPDAAGAPIFDAAFAEPAAAAPFNWTLTASALGAADIRGGGLAVDYYGRDSGDLASQLILLKPGRYRFSTAVEPGKTDNAAGLIWTISCTTGDHAALANLRVVAGATGRRLSTDFTVPAGCPAQALVLRGEAGEFPVAVSVTLRQPEIRSLGGDRS